MKKMKDLKDPKLKEEYMKAIKNSHEDTLTSFDNEVLETITSKEITPEEAKDWFKNRKSKQVAYIPDAKDIGVVHATLIKKGSLRKF